MSERGNGAIIFALSIGLLYLAVWIWCKLTGQKPEFES